MRYNTAANLFELSDTATGISLLETATGGAFSIAKISAQTNFTENTEMNFKIGVNSILRIDSSGINLADHDIDNIKDMRWFIAGQAILSTLLGLEVSVPAGQFLTAKEGANTIFSANASTFSLDTTPIQMISAVPPAPTGANNVGKIFMDSTNSHHLSVIRNGGVIDLEAAVGGNTFDDSLFQIFDDVDNTKKIMFDASLLTPLQTAVISVPPISSDIMVTRTAQLTLTNKDLDDDTVRIKNSANNRFLRFDVDSITSGSTSVLTIPDKDGTIALLSDLGSGGTPSQIKVNDTEVTISDTGAGSIVGKVDNEQKFNVTDSSFTFDIPTVFGSLAGHTATFQAEARFNDNVKLGNDGSDEISADGEWVTDIDFRTGSTIDFGSSVSSASAGFSGALPSSAAGYIDVLVNGVPKKLVVFDP